MYRKNQNNHIDKYKARKTVKVYIELNLLDNLCYSIIWEKLDLYRSMYYIIFHRLIAVQRLMAVIKCDIYLFMVGACGQGETFL